MTARAVPPLLQAALTENQNRLALLAMHVEPYMEMLHALAERHRELTEWCAGACNTVDDTVAWPPELDFADHLLSWFDQNTRVTLGHLDGVVLDMPGSIDNTLERVAARLRARHPGWGWSTGNVPPIDVDLDPWTYRQVWRRAPLSAHG